MLASFLAALAVLVGVGIGELAWNQAPRRAPSGPTRVPAIGPLPSTTAAGPRDTAAPGSPTDPARIAARVAPGLVDVDTVLGYQTAEAAGTGMVLSSSGEVLTNNHVIEGATRITATDLATHRTYRAQVVGYDRPRDVAVLRLVGAKGLPTVHLDASGTVAVGQGVVGIGNAGGVGGTPAVAGGKVTALHQTVTAADSLDGTSEHLSGLIETNCDIRPGDSGGPLVDRSAAVVGMDTAASAAQGFEFKGAAAGQGYAIPIPTALGIVHAIEAGTPTSTVHLGATAFLGVVVGTAATSTRPLGIPLPTTTTTATPAPGASGVPVVRVLPSTPAAAAGIAPGDVVTAVGGSAVTSPDQLANLIGQHHPGDELAVTWITPTGAASSATVTLASGPAG